MKSPYRSAQITALAFFTILTRAPSALSNDAVIELVMAESLVGNLYEANLETNALYVSKGKNAFVQAEVKIGGYSCNFNSAIPGVRKLTLHAGSTYAFIPLTKVDQRASFLSEDGNIMMSCTGSDLSSEAIAGALAQDSIFQEVNIYEDDGQGGNPVPKENEQKSNEGNFPFGSTLTEKTETKISAGNFPFVEESNSKSVNTGEVKTESSTSTLTSGCELNDRVTTALDQGISDKKFFNKFGVVKSTFVKNGSCWVNSLVLGASNQITSSDDKTISQELHTSGEDEAKKNDAN